MTLRRTEKPSAFPVSVADARTHLNIEDGVDEALLFQLIAAATAHLDGERGILGRCLIEQDYELILPEFPRGPIMMPLPPLMQLTTINYLAPDGEPSFILPADCRIVGMGSEDAVSIYPPGSAWPATMQDPEAVVIDFKAGYGDPENVPEPLRRAILTYVGTLYANRESTTTGPNSPRFVDEAYEALIAPYRVWRY